MANSADPDQLLIWIYTVCKGKVYSGSDVFCDPRFVLLHTDPIRKRGLL